MLPRLLRYLTMVELVVLFGAGAGLFFLPGPTGDAWPWELTPFTTRFLGAVYLAAYVAVALMLWIGRWAPARVTVWALGAFTAIVFAISLIELDRFDLSRPVTWVWLALYLILPLNAAYHLWRYRSVQLPAPSRVGPVWSALLFGSAALLGVYSIGLLALPDASTEFWPWPVDDFHARMYSAAFVAVAVGLYAVARAARPVEFFSVGLTHATLALMAIVGLFVVDRSRGSVDWSAAGVWLWVGGFATLLGLSLAMIATSRLALPVPQTSALSPERGQDVARGVTLFFAIAFITAGITGFLPAFTSDPPADAHHLEVTASYGYLLGLYPVNLLHNLLHLGFGFAALAALAGRISIRRYNRALALILGALFLAGLVPGLETAFGLVPLFSHDIWLHGLEALAAGYVGFVLLGAPAAAGVAPRSARTA